MQEHHLRKLILKLLASTTEMAFNELAAEINIGSDAFIRRVLDSLIQERLVEYEKSKPRKYKLTEKGKEIGALEENQ